MSDRIAWPKLRYPLVAILRGIRPEETEAIVGALIETGFEAIEIPLNSPEPFMSIAKAVKLAPANVLIGAGTVLSVEDVDRLNDVGGRLLVSPNVEPDVIRRAGQHGMVTMPGVFTPTEAGVVAAVYSLFVATVIYRELPLSRLYPAMVDAAKTTAVVMFLVASASVSAWMITVADVPGELADLVRPLMDNQTLLLLAIMLMVVLVGMAMDMTPTILILTPVLMPIIKEAGIDPVYFGVLFIINNSIGLITPPVGTVLNVVCGVARLPFEKVMTGVLPFLIAQLVVLFLMVLFPQLVTVPMGWFH